MKDGGLYLFDSLSVAHLVGQFLNQSGTRLVVNQLFRIIGQQEIAKLILDILLRSTDDKGREALVQFFDSSHTFLLLFHTDIVSVDVLGNSVNLLANLHHGIVKDLPLVVAVGSSYTGCARNVRQGDGNLTGFHEERCIDLVACSTINHSQVNTITFAFIGKTAVFDNDGILRSAVLHIAGNVQSVAIGHALSGTANFVRLRLTSSKHNACCCQKEY